MAKQMIKGLTMVMIVVALAFVSAVASANGQSRQQRATIPFEFVVGDKTLPSGQYAVGAITDSGAALRVSSTEQGQSAARLTTTITRSKADGGKLVFLRYANHYFLSEVWTAGETTGRRLTKSAQQKAIESEMAAVKSNSDWAKTGFEIVEVAVR